MQAPLQCAPQAITSDTYRLPAYLPVPGAGILPVNAFVIRAAQPLLVDTDLAALKTAFIQGLSQVINPAELAWIWLTHTDPDHLGNLAELLALAPRARLITTFLGMGKLGLQALPLDRVYLLNPGQHLDLGDRTVIAIQPPVFDAPETTGLFDTQTRLLFSSDCFGAVMQHPADSAQAIGREALHQGLVRWTLIDAPWLPRVAAATFEQTLEPIRCLEAAGILSSHLPPALGLTDALLADLRAARQATPVPGPDQAALEQMMAQASMAS